MMTNSWLEHLSLVFEEDIVEGPLSKDLRRASTFNPMGSCLLRGIGGELVINIY